jgi:ribosomal-protein-alanine N-acetyltransferase
MPLIFSYGTLQKEKVQLSTFGRLLIGAKDELSGFEKSLVEIDDSRTLTDTEKIHYDNVRLTDRNEDRVSGTAFEITDAELVAADTYERDADYQRILVTLESGKEAWVYLHRPIWAAVLDPPTELRTPRLFLRKPRRQDAPAMFAAYAQDPQVTKFLLWKPHPDVSESYRVVDRFIWQWKSKAEFSWFIFHNDTQQLIGSIGARPKTGGFELGYVLAQPHWGKGYMPEAIGAVVQWAFTDPSVFRISAACDVENRASARALEKAGFVTERVLSQFSVHPNVSNAPRDCYRYVMLRPERDETFSMT